MKTQTTISRLEDEIQRLQPVLDELNDETINNNIEQLDNTLQELRDLAQQLALQDMGLFTTIPQINTENQTALKKFWSYYQLWKTMKKFKQDLNNLKTEIELRPNLDQNLKAQMIDKINQALNLVDQILNSIPQPLKNYFEQKEVELSQPFPKIDIISNIIIIK